ncbi:MAG: ImmA/IrrE family metallo-endopeptidase, partial [Actinomycetota bacterium]|nr:ImmA/IrrE family metallo-endopeptidase [Actinomycetota bacterium]
MERRSGINSGYLSQLERNEIAQPSPSVLGRIADSYGEPFEVLMEWAGYIRSAPEGLSPNKKRALNFIPDDINDQELKALRAVLAALRGNDASANSLRKRHRYDIRLQENERLVVKATAKALLREMDAMDSDQAVDLDQALSVAKLVEAGVIELDLNQKKRLRDRFGHLVDWALSNLQGMVNLDSGEVFVQPGLYEPRRRFVLAHEIGHAALEDHRLVFAHLDDDKRLDPEFEDRLESQANHFSIELLSKGDRLRQEFDGSQPTIANLRRVTSHFGISLQAGARRIAEETRQECAIAIAWRANRGRGSLYLDSYKVLTSASFEQRFRWQTLGPPVDEIKSALRSIAASGLAEPFSSSDLGGNNALISVDGRDAHFAVIAM